MFEIVINVSERGTLDTTEIVTQLVVDDYFNNTLDIIDTIDGKNIDILLATRLSSESKLAINEDTIIDLNIKNKNIYGEVIDIMADYSLENIKRDFNSKTDHITKSGRTNFMPKDATIFICPNKHDSNARYKYIFGIESEYDNEYITFIGVAPYL